MKTRLIVSLASAVVSALVFRFLLLGLLGSTGLSILVGAAVAVSVWLMVSLRNLQKLQAAAQEIKKVV